jgi:hypothetical protein
MPKRRSVSTKHTLLTIGSGNHREHQSYKEPSGAQHSSHSGLLHKTRKKPGESRGAAAFLKRRVTSVARKHMRALMTSSDLPPARAVEWCQPVLGFIWYASLAVFKTVLCPP